LTEEYESSSPDKSIILDHNVNTTEPDTPMYDKDGYHTCGTWNEYGIGDGNLSQGIKYNIEYGEFPFMVAIFKEELSQDGEKKLMLRCEGSLIEKNVVLTAAHCVIK